jgi:AcrR family transcriptional regulator
MRGSRAEKAAARREAILAAALDEFAAQGFAATRLDDVARRAGVGKGTIYLHFRDKEQLFQELVRSMIVPQVEVLEAGLRLDLPIRLVVTQFFDRFVREIYGTRRREVLRLILTEGQRFPHLAEFYYHAVVERGVAAVRDALRRAHARGELPSEALVNFPQLIIAPAVVAVVWSGMFERFSPLDVEALLRAHLELLFGSKT